MTAEFTLKSLNSLNFFFLFKLSFKDMTLSVKITSLPIAAPLQSENIFI